MKFVWKEMLSLPNLLTLLRIFLVPFFVLTYVNAFIPKEYYLAGFFLLIIAFTDFADGYIARRFDMQTEMGKFLDPLADKIAQIAILCSLTFKISNMLYLVLLLVIKELFMGFCCLILIRRDVYISGAKWYGKLSTIVFFVTMFVMVAFVPEQNVVIQDAIIFVSGSFIMLAFVNYANLYLGMIKKSNKSKSK